MKTTRDAEMSNSARKLQNMIIKRRQEHEKLRWNLKHKQTLLFIDKAMVGIANPS